MIAGAEKGRAVVTRTVGGYGTEIIGPVRDA